MGAYSYSTTAASNTSIDGLGNNGAVDPPSNIDNLIGRLAASDAAFVRDLGGANTVAGTADAITVALTDPTAATAYFDGMRLSFRAASDNTAADPTLNADSIGTKKIRKAVAGVETALIAGDIQAGATCEVIYRSAWDSATGAFELLNPYYSSNPLLVDGQVTFDGSSVPTNQLNTLSSVNLGISRWSNNASSAQIRFAKSRGTSINSRTAVQSGDNIADITFAGDDGTNFIRAASIQVAVDGTPGTNDMPGRIVFSTTADGASSVTERLSIKSDGSWNIAGVDASNGMVIKKVSGATAWGGPVTLVPASTASGSSVSFSSIPSWVRQIIISFYEVSLSGTDDILVQIGDSGGIETTGYVASGANSAGTVSTTSGFLINMSAAADLVTGQMILTSLGTSNDYWVASFSGKLSTTSMLTSGGSKQLAPGPLTQFQIVPTGANTFDTGLIGVIYL